MSSLLCRVQALYPFASDDPSSLKFKQGEHIDVLAKLSSGWWDGWCNGNRGWFPSNYVRVIENYGSTRSANTMLDLFDDRIEGNKREYNCVSLPANWTVRFNESATSIYYYNFMTGEVRSTYPYEDSASCEEDSDDDLCSYHTEEIPRASSLVDVHEIKPTEDIPISDHTLKETPSSAKWLQCTTTQGIPFFYSISDHDTNSALELQEYYRGLTKHNPSRKSKLLIRETFQLEDEVTWNKLLMHITLAINNVIAAAKNNRVSLCKSNVALVVDAIRHMLIATGTIHKQSIHLRTSATLRSHHRAMMASLSKLVLSAQLCASNTADISKVISDGHELLATVRNFVTSCESKSVEINPANPLLLNTRDESDSRRISQCSTESGEGRTKYDLQPDLIESLDAYGESMQESMELLINNLTRRSDSRSSLAVLLFTQYRNFVSENSQFLSIIADIDFHDVKHSNTMKCLCSSKQLLYDGLGTLFCNMQSMTNESVSMDTMISDMQNAAQSIIHAIKSTCDYISQLVEEKHALSHERKEQNKSLISNRDEFPPDLVSSDIPLDLSSQLSSDLLKSSISTDNDSDFSRLLTPASRRHSKRVSFSGFDPYTQTPGTHTSAKLKQFFGDDIPYIESYKTDTLDSASSYLVPTNKKSEEDEQRYLHYDYHPSDIVFAKDGSVKGGTLKALVERMTLHDYLDMNFNSTFLLTYRSFCTSIELLSLLEARYNIQPPGNLSSFDLEIWTTKKQKLIRLRVFNVLKIWLEQYYYEEDSVILDRLQEFTNTSIKSTLSFSAVHLERLIQKRKEARTDFKKLVMTQQLDCPEPILPRNIKKFRLMDVDTIEMARQLTLMDFKLYSSIKPIECLDKAWSRDMKGGKNIKASIEYCNQITTWVSDSILSEHEVKKRSNLIKYWVNVADKCRTYNNFNTCMAILSAFDNSAIGRLKRTWELVGARTNHIASNIRQIMGTGRNFGQYRVLIHSVNPPCIPFLGIYLQDLTFIEDGNPNFLKSSSTLINFAKRAKTAEVIREIQQYQSMGYPFKPVEEIQSFVIEQLSSTRDEEQLYHESLKLEPKEREDEKIARLLQESGFL